MRHILTIFLFGIASCSCFAQPFSTSFEPPVNRTVNDSISYNPISLSCYPYNNVLDSNYARTGFRSLRSDLYSTDVCFNNSRRAEGQVLKLGADTAREEEWYAFSVYPSLFTNYMTQQGLVMQLFNGAQGVNPNIALWISPDPSGQFMNWYLNLKVDTLNPNGTIHQTGRILQRQVNYRWTDFIFHVNWKNSYQGWVDVYIGQPGVTPTLVLPTGGTHTYSGATLNKQFNPSQPRWPSFRFGAYWFGWPTPGLQYPVTHITFSFDNINIGDSTNVLSDFYIPTNIIYTKPTVSAGANQVITLPTSSATLTGVSTATTGIILSRTWTQIGGTAATIVSPNSDVTNITGLTTAGVRTFKLKSIATNQLADSSIVTVTVNAEPPPMNLPPVVNAGSPQTITLPTTSVSLSGSATDPDGTIVSYQWAKISGTGGTITTPTNQNTTVTGLSVGTYIFSLTATDNVGATGSATVQVNVVNAPTTPRMRARRG